MVFIIYRHLIMIFMIYGVWPISLDITIIVYIQEEYPHHHNENRLRVEDYETNQFINVIINYSFLS
jgi:hypothetical protein